MRTMDRKLWTKGYRYSGPRTIRTMCNRMHLHIVLVLLYTVCLSVSLAFSSFGCWGWGGGGIMTSFHCFNTYVLRDNILDVTERRCARKKKKKEKKREATPPVSRRYHQKRIMKQEYLAVARLLLPTCDRLLPSTVDIWTKG